MSEQTGSNQLLAFLRRRLKYVALATIAALAFAAVYAQATAVQTHTCVGTMLYNRAAPPVPHYQPPEVQSIAGLTKSPAVLAMAAAHFVPAPSLKSLADSVQAEVLLGSGTLQYTMRGSDPQRTRELLERLMEAVAQQAGDVRRRTIEGILASQAAQLEEARAAAGRAADALAAFNAKHAIIVSVDDDLERVLDEAAAVETAVETNRPEHVDPEELLRRRRAALQEHLDAERQAIARASELELKRNEFERAARLHAKQYISDAEYRRVETEYRALEAQNGAAVEQWRRRLSDIDRALSEQLRDDADAAPTKNIAANAGDEGHSTRMRDFLARKHAEAERLNALRGEAARLQRAATAAHDDVSRIATLVRACDDLRNAPFHDLVVVQPAAPALDPPTSNKKKLFALGFAGIFAGCVFPLFLWDTFGPNRRRAAIDALNRVETSAWERLPMIGPAEKSNEAVRAAALRIQQAAKSDGSVALLCRLDADGTATGAAADIAACLEHRGERVLVVQATADADSETRLTEQLIEESEPVLADAVVADWTGSAARTESRMTASRRDGTAVLDASAASALGLSDLLADADLPAAEVVRRGMHFDFVLAGTAKLDPEAFAARRISELLGQWRREYSTVLVVAPGLSRTVDWQLLAARVTSVLFTHRGGEPSDAACWAVEELTALNAPILGVAKV